MTTIATAGDNSTTVIVKESGARGLDGTAGADGSGFNNIRKLLLDNPTVWLYKKNRLANVLSGTINIDRSSLGSFIDMHNILQTESPDFPREARDGWLIEPTRENILLDSEQFQNWGVVGTPVTTVNSTIAPDGTLTADTIEDDDAAAFERYIETFVLDPTKTYTLSGFILKDGIGRATRFPKFRVVFSGSTGETNDLDIDTATGEINTIFNDPVGKASTELIGNYFKFSITVKSQDLANNILELSVFPAVGSSISYAISVTAVGSIVAWGFQIEKSKFATSYNKTLSSTVTRSDEIHKFPVLNNIPLLNNGFSCVLKFINYEEEAVNQNILIVPDDVSGNVFSIGTASGKWEAIIKGSDSIDYKATTSINISTGVQILVVTVENGVIDLFVNGNTINGTATIATLKTSVVDTAGVCTIAGDFIINLQSLKFYDFVLNPDEIQHIN